MLFRSDTGKIKVRETKAELEEEMSRALRDCEDLEKSTDVEAQWKALRTAVYNTAEKVCEKSKRKHQGWFDELDKHLGELLEQRKNAIVNMLQTNTRSNRSKYTEARRKLQRYTRKLKSDWWEEKAESLQHAADKNDMKSFYRGLREVYGPAKRGTLSLQL